MKMFDVVEAAYLEGYRAGLEKCAFWKDGILQIGHAVHVPLAGMLAVAPEAIKADFNRWMTRQLQLLQPAPSAQEDSLPQTTIGATDGGH